MASITSYPTTGGDCRESFHNFFRKIIAVANSIEDVELFEEMSDGKINQHMLTIGNPDGTSTLWWNLSINQKKKFTLPAGNHKGTVVVWFVKAQNAEHFTCGELFF